MSYASKVCSLTRISLSLPALLALGCAEVAPSTETSTRLPWAPGTEPDEKSICDQGILANADWDEVEDGTVPQQTWAASVGSLRWDAGVGGNVDGERWCTGTLVAPNLFLTAGHCLDEDNTTASGWTLPTGVETAQEFCDRMHVQFNFQLVNGAVPAEANMPTFDCEDVVASRLGDGLDYALVRLDGEPGEEFGYREMDFRAPANGETVTIVQHPSGMSKKVHTGTISNITSTSMGHDMDTLGGSSGSPILDAEGRLIGVHTNGGCSDSAGTTNTAKRLDDIYDEVEELGALDYFDQNEEGDVEAGDQFGFAVAVGDFDGDGFGDVAVGAPGENPGGAAAYAGYVSIRYGSTEGPDASDTVGLGQSGGSSPEGYDYFGRRLVTGDFDGDGYDDLVVGTPYEDWGSTTNTGVVQVWYGEAAGIAGGSAASDWFTSSRFGLTQAASQYTGDALAVGDFDNDGYDDLAIGIWGDSSSAGAVGMAYGSAWGLSAVTSFDQADTGAGSVESGDNFGRSLAAGDFDGDGYDDLAVGAPGETPGSGPTRAGYMILVYGSWSGLSMSGANGFGQGNLAATNNNFGYIASTGDFNGDGRDDLAVGVPYDDYRGTSAGLVSIAYGDTAGISAIDVHYSHATVGPGFNNYDYFGRALATGDLDGDGYDDLLVGVPGDDNNGTNSGMVDVINGSSWGRDGGQSLDQLELMDSQNGDYFGYTIATGDVDGDGDDDVILGMPYADSLGASSSGAVIVLDVE